MSLGREKKKKMSNKRIQKKRAKAEWQREKSELVDLGIVAMYPGCTREEYLRMSAHILRMKEASLVEWVMRANLLRMRACFLCVQ